MDQKLTSSPFTKYFQVFNGDVKEQLKKLHEHIWDQILKQIEKYSKHANKHRKLSVFKEGDLMWIHLRKKNNFHPNVPLSLCLELVVCSRCFSTLNKMHIKLNSLVTMVSGSQQPSMFLIFIFIMRMKTTNKWTWGQVFINWESQRSAKSISAA